MGPPAVETGTLWLDIMGSICLVIAAVRLVIEYVNRGSRAIEGERKALKTFQGYRVKDVAKLEEDLFRLMNEADSRADLPVPASRKSRLTAIHEEIEVYVHLPLDHRCLCTHPQ